MKTIPPDSYAVRPFRANKTWTNTFTYLGTNNPTSASIDLASATTNWLNFISSSTDQANTDGIFPRTLYDSIQKTFYTSSADNGLRFSPIDPFYKNFYPTGSQFYVVNMHQKTFGEGIRPGTFKITGAASTASLFDDGDGHIISSTATSSIIGNIFYGAGIAVIAQDTGSYSGSFVTDKGLYMTTGSVFTIEYAGIQTIYEHTVVATVDPGEFNFSSNPSLNNNTILVSGSSFYPSSGSQAGALMLSGSMPPYFTTIGLYNDAYELVAVAKVGRPIQRSVNTQQTVVIHFDF